MSSRELQNLSLCHPSCNSWSQVLSFTCGFFGFRAYPKAPCRYDLWGLGPKVGITYRVRASGLGKEKKNGNYCTEEAHGKSNRQRLGLGWLPKQTYVPPKPRALSKGCSGI